MTSSITLPTSLAPNSGVATCGPPGSTGSNCIFQVCWSHSSLPEPGSVHTRGLTDHNVEAWIIGLETRFSRPRGPIGVVYRRIVGTERISPRQGSQAERERLDRERAISGSTRVCSEDSGTLSPEEEASPETPRSPGRDSPGSRLVLKSAYRIVHDGGGARKIRAELANGRPRGEIDILRPRQRLVAWTPATGRPKSTSCRG